jgi:hypothetical protein
MNPKLSRNSVHLAFATLTITAAVAGMLFAISITKNSSPARHLSSTIVLSYLATWGLLWFFSQAPTSEKGAKFLIFTATLLFGLALLEMLAFAKVVDYRLLLHTPSKDPLLNPDNVLDPDLLHIHRPYLRSSGRLVGGDIAEIKGLKPLATYEYDVRYDRHGFRNRKDLDAAEIVMIGDSFIEAGRVTDQELLNAKLEQALGMTVANLGQNNYGPQQELVVLKRFGLRLRPRICLWFFFEGNDLLDVHNYELTKSRWESEVNRARSFAQRSFTANALPAVSRLLNGSKARAPRDADPVGYFQLASGTSQPVYFYYEGRPLSSDDLLALQTARGIFAEALAACLQNETRLIVVFVPSKFRVYKDVCTFKQKSVVATWVANDLPEQLKRSLEPVSAAIGFLDLTPGMVSAGARGKMLYHLDDTHWSAAGHTVVADIVANFLATQHYVGSNQSHPSIANSLEKGRQ